MLIQVLGPGCAKCKKTAEHVQQAVAESGSDAVVEKIEQIDRIIAFGVMTTPALVIDGKVRIAGRVPSVEEIKRIIAPGAVGGAEGGTVPAAGTPPYGGTAGDAAGRGRA